MTRPLWLSARHIQPLASHSNGQESSFYDSYLINICAILCPHFIIEFILLWLSLIGTSFYCGCCENAFEITLLLFASET
jgi:hypothetical protein